MHRGCDVGEPLPPFATTGDRWRRVSEQEPRNEIPQCAIEQYQPGEYAFLRNSCSERGTVMSRVVSVLAAVLMTVASVPLVTSGTAAAAGLDLTCTPPSSARLLFDPPATTSPQTMT